jgi:hypothetical protein
MGKIDRDGRLNPSHVEIWASACSVAFVLPIIDDMPH